MEGPDDLSAEHGRRALRAEQKKTPTWAQAEAEGLPRPVSQEAGPHRVYLRPCGDGGRAVGRSGAPLIAFYMLGSPMPPLVLQRWRLPRVFSGPKRSRRTCTGHRQFRRAFPGITGTTGRGGRCLSSRIHEARQDSPFYLQPQRSRGWGFSFMMARSEWLIPAGYYFWQRANRRAPTRQYYRRNAAPALFL
jgi:hypothetical protein